MEIAGIVVSCASVCLFLFCSLYDSAVGPPQVKQLIKQLLDTDPSKRITIEQMWRHPWISVSRAIPVLCVDGSVVHDTHRNLLFWFCCFVAFRSCFRQGSMEVPHTPLLTPKILQFETNLTDTKV